MSSAICARLSQSFLAAALISTSCLLNSTAWAWSTLGHSSVNMSAAHLLSDRKDFKFLRRHAFELSYYSNVPDLLWKRPETYPAESTQHYMDLEFFVAPDTEKSNSEKFKTGKGEINVNIEDFKMDRMSFEKKYPSISPQAGRSYWRIQEFMAKLRGIEKELQNKDLNRATRVEKQMQWLIVAGTMGHYVGDLGQPLHLTDNHDGQKTDQKGIHSYFEATVVDEIGPEVTGLALREARAKEKAFAKANAGKTDLELINELGLRSYKHIPELLAIDKKHGRKDLAKSAELYRKMVIERLADSALVLSELWSRTGNWPYDGDKFYEFSGEPPMIPLPEGARIGLNDTQPKSKPGSAPAK